jgi:hypothetical protein
MQGSWGCEFAERDKSHPGWRGNGKKTENVLLLRFGHSGQVAKQVLELAEILTSLTIN